MGYRRTRGDRKKMKSQWDNKNWNEKINEQKRLDEEDYNPQKKLNEIDYFKHYLKNYGKNREQ